MSALPVDNVLARILARKVEDVAERSARVPRAELAARLKSSDQPELAQKFMEYVLSPDFQGMIAEANWSYPSKLARDRLPPYFAALDRPERTIFLSETEAEELRKPALEEWLSVFAQ